MNTPIRTEISRWSDLPKFLEEYNELVRTEGNGIGRIFGYASIISNHKAEKPSNSLDIPNEKARVNGMEVAMNVYATGQFELRGTTDLDRGIHNVGLYAGMEPALTPDGYADGLNITVSQEDMAKSFKAYLAREIGNPPLADSSSEKISLDDIIAQGADGRIELTAEGQKHLASLKGKPEDNFGLYKLQIINSQTAGGLSFPALSVSTNEKSPFAAIGLSPKQAAHYILDGQGYVREQNGSLLGGDALDYFINTINSYEEYGLEQPRITAIAGEVVNMARGISEFHAAASNPDTSTTELAAIASRVLEPDIIGGEKFFVASVRPEKFGGRDLINRGNPSPELKNSTTLPRTAVEKDSRISDILAQGKLTPLERAAARSSSATIER